MCDPKLDPGSKTRVAKLGQLVELGRGRCSISPKCPHFHHRTMLCTSVILSLGNTHYGSPDRGIGSAVYSRMAPKAEGKHADFK